MCQRDEEIKNRVFASNLVLGRNGGPSQRLENTKCQLLTFCYCRLPHFCFVFFWSLFSFHLFQKSSSLHLSKSFLKMMPMPCVVRLVFV